MKEWTNYQGYSWEQLMKKQGEEVRDALANGEKLLTKHQVETLINELVLKELYGLVRGGKFSFSDYYEPSTDHAIYIFANARAVDND